MLSVPHKLVSILFFLSIFTSASVAQTSEEQVDKNKISEYFQNEQYAEAIQYLESNNVIRSTDINSINALGYAYYMSENYLLAQENYLRALALDSLNFTANRYSALISRENKDYGKQLFYYLRLLQIQPSNGILYKLTGDTYKLLKNDDTALLFYAKAYHFQPANTKITVAYIENLLDKDSYTTADSVTKAFLEKDTLNAAVMRLAIRSFTTQRKMADAARFTKNWLLTGEIEPKTTVSLAQSNYAIKQYEACYKVCNNLLEQGIETEALFYYASQAKYKLNEFIKSSELLKQCLNLAISKNTNLYYFSLADNFESLKQYKRAIASYDTAYYLFHDPLALYNIGRLYEQGLQNNNTARQYYKKYMALAKPKTKDEQRVYAYVKELLKGQERKQKENQ
ncbi:MAG: hypothetical protein JWR18_2764 [Segetibacter sp.]|jgi:tetratricopeptide (TPR) repeat protein|nr:hypothetical protein [Segetibacter sp.]